MLTIFSFKQKICLEGGTPTMLFFLSLLFLRHKGACPASESLPNPGFFLLYPIYIWNYYPTDA
jgi:hypothetical protein